MLVYYCRASFEIFRARCCKLSLLIVAIDSNDSESLLVLFNIQSISVFANLKTKSHQYTAGFIV